MKIIAWLVAFLTLIVSVWVISAKDAQSAELSMPNDMDGHVYLLDEPCATPMTDAQVAAVPDDVLLYQATSIRHEGDTNEDRAGGCWFSMVPPVVDPEDVQVDAADTQMIPVKFVQLVNIAADDGNIYTNPLADFLPAIEAPPKKDDSI